MKVTVLYVGFVLFLAGCSSSSAIFPPTEESAKKIAELKPRLDSLDGVLSQSTQRYSPPLNVITRFRTNGINRLLDAFALKRLDDIHINFLATRPLWKEEKSTFGIAFTNYVDVDTGSIVVDLKKFHIVSANNNVVTADMEIEGNGKIKVSGKFAGLTATASPQIHFYLNDNVQFSISTADSQTIVLTPLPKLLLLKAQISMQMLQLQIPYYREIALQAAEILTPLRIPTALKSEIVFPIPASQFGNQKLEFVHRTLDFSRYTVSANNNSIEIKTNINFVK
ncbi:MAG: hypothetical protein PHP42_01965 [Bacteroidota bacterium]|nr:hypothetical protein [Bacteroidota bacterium]